MGTMTTRGKSDVEFYNGYIRLTTTEFTYQSQHHKKWHNQMIYASRWGKRKKKEDFMIKEKWI